MRKKLETDPKYYQNCDAFMPPENWLEHPPAQWQTLVHARYAAFGGAEVFSAVSSHIEAASAPESSAYALGKEDQGYMATDKNYSVWSQGLINKSHKEENSGASSFSGRSTGLAGGADLKLGDNWIAGLGYAYTHSNVDSLQRHNRILGDNFFAYGQYRPGQFYVQGTLNYGDSKYEEEKYLPGMQVNADYHIKTYAANVTAGYEVNEWLTPLFTVRS